jgi:hypothetical protein
MGVGRHPTGAVTGGAPRHSQERRLAVSRVGFFLVAETLRARMGQLEDGTMSLGAWPYFVR